MILQAGDQVYTLHLRYDPPTPAMSIVFQLTARQLRRQRRQTHATLHPGRCPEKTEPNGVCIVPGSVSVSVPCSTTDEFVKAKGRKLALAAAMRELVKDHATRAALWNDFRRQTKEIA